MKCPVCGAENPDTMKFCGICGDKLPEPLPGELTEPQAVESPVAHPRQSWMRSHWIVVVVLIVVAIIVIASLGLIYTQPWSKMKILAKNTSGYSASYAFSIDGVEKARGTIYPGDFVIVGVWRVSVGSHSIDADCHYLGALGPALDGEMEYSYEYDVGPLFTKNVWIEMNPATPNLVGDLALYYDAYDDEVSIEGTVFNYGNAPCYGTLSYTISDARGWSIADVVQLGRVDGDGGSVIVFEYHDWPYIYGGQYNNNIVPYWQYTLTFS